MIFSGRWSTKISYIVGFFLLLLVLIGCTAQPSAGQQVEHDWAFFIYGGQWTDNTFGNILLDWQTEYDNSYLWTVGLSRSIYQVNRHVSVEIELNTTAHSGLQDHLELNGAISFRWNSFPWEQLINSSVSHGLGPSLAVRHPEVEKGSDGNSDRALLYMQTEISFAPAVDEIPWEIFFRLHHRSGVFGLISHKSGSNYLAMGLRYRF